MYDATPSGPPRSSVGRIAAVVTLAVAVVGIIGVAFRGSWGALRDAALAAHFDRSAADLYPWGVDGLQVVAIIALVLLRHNSKARQYCLGIIIGYTAASWLINFLHGLGTFTPDPVTHIRPVPPWPVVFVIALLVIGSIFLGSHLLVFAWRHVFPDAPQPVEEQTVYQGVPPVPPLPPDAFTVAKDAYRKSLDPDLKTLSQTDLIERYRITKREAARVQSEVKAETSKTPLFDALAETLGEPSQNGQGPA